MLGRSELLDKVLTQSFDALQKPDRLVMPGSVSKKISLSPEKLQLLADYHTRKTAINAQNAAAKAEREKLRKVPRSHKARVPHKCSGRGCSVTIQRGELYRTRLALVCNPRNTDGMHYEKLFFCQNCWSDQ